MPRIPSFDEFVAVVRRSGLVSDAEVASAIYHHNQTRAGFRDARLLAADLVSRQHLTAWQSSVLLSGLPASFFIDKYRLLSRLGTGGTSTVYLAKHSLWQRPCAIKVLNRSRLESPAALQRFLRESQVTARFDHPHIVKAYDVGELGDLLYLVMEYVDGPSLQALVETNGPLPAHTAAEFLAQAASGLAKAHELNFVHRDVKPANLLITKAGVVKVADLGLARVDGAAEGGPQLTYDQGGMLGTVDYLAPEQALDSHAVDDRADVYSLGCTFYFTLVGQPPFSSRTLAQTLLKHQSRDPDDVGAKRSDVPRGLIELLNAMMQKAPEDRPSMAETAMLLRGWLDCNPQPMDAACASLVRSGCRTPEGASVAIGGASSLGPLPPSNPRHSSSDAFGVDEEGPNSSLNLVEAPSSMLWTPPVSSEASSLSATDTVADQKTPASDTSIVTPTSPNRTRCPQCQRSLRLPPNAGGRRARCPSCRGVFIVPTGAEPPHSV